MNGTKIFTGSKFFRYIDGEDHPEVIRITKVDEPMNNVKYITDDKIKMSMKLDKLLFEYKLLSPDGIINICLASVEDKIDVIVTFKNLKNNIDDRPDVVCRQLIYDFFTNNMKKSDNVNYVGVSVSRDTCPSNINFDDVFLCNGIKDNIFIAVYLEDQIDGILSLFNHKKYDYALKMLSNNPPYADGRITLGFNPSLEELLKNNNFMYDFRKSYGIMELPFAIDPDKDGLSMQNILFMENELKVNIMETYVIKYSREINTREFNRRWLLAASAQDQFKNIYIVGYDISDGQYVKRSI